MVKYFITFLIILLPGCYSHNNKRSFEIGDTITYNKIDDKLEKVFITDKHHYYYILESTSRDSYYHSFLICDTNNVIIDVLYDNPDIFANTWVPNILTVNNDTIYSVSYGKNIDESHVFPSDIKLRNHCFPNLHYQNKFMGNVKNITFNRDSVILQVVGNRNCELEKDTLVSFSINSIYDGYLGLNATLIPTEKEYMKGNHTAYNFTYEVTDSIKTLYYSYLKGLLKIE